MTDRVFPESSSFKGRMRTAWSQSLQCVFSPVGATKSYKPDLSNESWFLKSFPCCRVSALQLRILLVNINIGGSPTHKRSVSPDDYAGTFTGMKQKGGRGTMTGALARPQNTQQLLWGGGGPLVYGDKIALNTHVLFLSH